MVKTLAVVAMILVAMMALQFAVLADDAPAQVRSEATQVGGQGGQPYVHSAYLPLAPVPPGVIGGYGQLPCAIPLLNAQPAPAAGR